MPPMPCKIGEHTHSPLMSCDAQMCSMFECCLKTWELPSLFIPRGRPWPWFHSWTLSCSKSFTKIIKQLDRWIFDEFHCYLQFFSHQHCQHHPASHSWHRGIWSWSQRRVRFHPCRLPSSGPVDFFKASGTVVPGRPRSWSAWVEWHQSQELASLTLAHRNSSSFREIESAKDGSNYKHGGRHIHLTTELWMLWKWWLSIKWCNYR